METGAGRSRFPPVTGPAVSAGQISAAYDSRYPDNPRNVQSCGIQTLLDAQETFALVARRPIRDLAS